MTCDTINMLVGLLPGPEDPRDRFVQTYKNPACGWNLAVRFAGHGRLPVALHGRDSWVFRAYMAARGPRRFRDRVIEEARNLAQLPEGKNISEGIRALIISGVGAERQAHLRGITEQLGIRMEVVEAFEALFYNVLDRFEDAAYLADLIYPESRIPELHEDYHRTADVYDLLKRAGYNYRDPDMAGYLMGLGDAGYMKGMAARENREEMLEKTLMSNGMLLANTGAVNARTPGLSRTTNIIAASRHGGQKTQELATDNIGDFLSAGLERAMETHRRQRDRRRRLDAGEVEAEIIE